MELQGEIAGRKSLLGKEVNMGKTGGSSWMQLCLKPIS